MDSFAVNAMQENYAATNAAITMAKAQG